MLGDRMLIYDKPNDRFFAGWKNGKHSGSPEQVPTWSKAVKGAALVYRPEKAYYIKEQLGAGVYIVSEKEAGRIEAYREYREAANEEA